MDWGDDNGSVSKVFILRVQGPEFDSEYHVKITQWNPSAGKVATDRSLGLAGQPETLCWLALCQHGTR